MNFFIAFMGNTSFVKNPYLRCKFVEVLRTGFRSKTVPVARAPRHSSR